MPGRNVQFPTGVNVSGRYRKWPVFNCPLMAGFGCPPRRTLDERVEVYRLLVNCERFGAQMAGDMHPEAIDVNHPDYDQDTIGEGLVEHAETQSSFEESCKSNLRDNEVFPSLIGVSEDEFKKLEVAIAEEVVSYVEAVEFMNSPFYYPELSDER